MSVGSAPFGDHEATLEVKERRVWVRHCCALEVFCADVGATRPRKNKRTDNGLTNPNQRWAAKVFDISRGGLKFETNHPFKVGSLFELEVDAGDNAAPLILQARVKHSLQLADDQWTIGCAFVVPLDRSELHTLLRFGHASRDISSSLLTRLGNWLSERLNHD